MIAILPHHGEDLMIVMEIKNQEKKESLDREWIKLMQFAKSLGLTKEEVRRFIEK
ncbi:anti-repressor SinI family protein [Halalkalibacillus halophilus]|uniref:anti-repressor SinI family protein n=1 Tax=Halalkalibacillus halophilus TaxID=392827 RepID=UPI0004170913|nr:anti-repressor SinI family protein [Halalkalibacillus halophilus]